MFHLKVVSAEKVLFCTAERTKGIKLLQSNKEMERLALPYISSYYHVTPSVQMLDNPWQQLMSYRTTQLVTYASAQQS